MLQTVGELSVNLGGPNKCWSTYVKKEQGRPILSACKWFKVGFISSLIEKGTFYFYCNIILLECIFSFNSGTIRLCFTFVYYFLCTCFTFKSVEFRVNMEWFYNWPDFRNIQSTVFVCNDEGSWWLRLLFISTVFLKHLYLNHDVI